jgi:hypothetical protein
MVFGNCRIGIHGMASCFSILAAQFFHPDLLLPADFNPEQRAAVQRQSLNFES